MDAGQTENLLVAVACLVPALPAGWKASSLRGDIGARWTERVDISHARLHQRAVSELQALQQEIGDVLGVSAIPGEVVVDPGPILDRVRGCAEILRVRDRVRARLRRHRRNGSFLLPIVVVYVIGWAAVTIYVTKAVSWHWLKEGGIGVCAAAIIAAIIVFAIYTYYESRLTAAEELASVG